MSGTILVVEDDASLNRSLTRNLSARGYMVRTAGTVATALQEIELACPDLVLLDIDLPDGSGWQVLRAIRGGSRAGTAVIVMSALRPNAHLASSLQCAAVLEKPFPMEALLRLTTESLERVARNGSYGAFTERNKVND